MYAQLTRDLFAIAKFLVVVPSIDFLNVLKADRKYHQSILSTHFYSSSSACYY